MNLSATIKTLIVAAVCYAGSLVVFVIGMPDTSSPDYVLTEDFPVPWSIYHYIALGLLMFAVGCTIAGFRLAQTEWQDEDD